MDTDTFIASLKAFQGMPQDMIDHACGLAPRMTDEARAAAFAKLQVLDAELVRQREEDDALRQEADALAKGFHRDVMIPLRRDVESAQQEEDSNAADTLLSDQ